MATHKDLARELLELARADATAAREMAEVAAVDDAIVAFHGQQAVEKSMKAVLAFADREFPFTHDLVELAMLCSWSLRCSAPRPTGRSPRRWRTCVG